MSLNLHLLRLFATVVKTGSFSRAGELLHISQPAISKGVRDFELQVGCRLLDRTPQGVRPTREGHALARHAASLFAIERAAEEELQALRGLDRGSLHVGASTTIATYLMPALLSAFKTIYPSIEIHIVSANTQVIADLMIDHEIEVALVEGPVENKHLVSEYWRTDAMVMIASPIHPLAKARHPVDIGTLADETLIVREEGSGSRHVVADTLSTKGIVPARTLEVGGTEATKQAVAANLGVAIVSACTIADQLALGKLVIVPVVDLAIERTLWHLKMPGRLTVPAAVAFEALLRP